MGDAGRDRLRRLDRLGRPLSTDEALRLLVESGRELAALHEQGQGDPAADVADLARAVEVRLARDVPDLLRRLLATCRCPDPAGRPSAEELVALALRIGESRLPVVTGAGSRAGAHSSRSSSDSRRSCARPALAGCGDPAASSRPRSDPQRSPRAHGPRRPRPRHRSRDGHAHRCRPTGPPSSWRTTERASGPGQPDVGCCWPRWTHRALRRNAMTWLCCMISSAEASWPAAGTQGSTG